MKSGSWSIPRVRETFYTISPFLCVATILLTVAAIVSGLKLHAIEWHQFGTALRYDANVLATKLLPLRIAWGTALFVFYLAFISLVATSIGVIWRSLDAWTRSARAGTVAALCLLSITVCALIRLENTSVSMIIELIRKNLDDCTNVILHAAWSGATAVIFTVAAACFILYSPKQKDEDRILHMNRQTTELRILLYIASLMLVAGIFEIKTLFTYLTVQVLPESSPEKLKLLLATAVGDTQLKLLTSQAGMIKDVADVTKTAAGCIFTALLAGMYLPAALVLDRRMTDLSARLGRTAAAASGVPPVLPSAPGAASKSYIPPALSQMMNLAATLAPFVLGTSLDLLGKLSR